MREREQCINVVETSIEKLPQEIPNVSNETNAFISFYGYMCLGQDKNIKYDEIKHIRSSNQYIIGSGSFL